LIHTPSGEGARSGARIEDCMSTRTMLALTLRRRLLNSSHAMAWKELPTRCIHRTWHCATSMFFGYIKRRLAAPSFEEPDWLLQAIFYSTENATLEHVFQEWTDRLAQCCVVVGREVECM
jgi:hypothetical protein